MADQKNDKPVNKDAKVPPQSLDSETSLLGAILLDPDGMSRIADAIHADDFYDKRHTIIYRNMLKLYEQRRPIDVVTLSNEMESSDSLAQAGGGAYLTDLANGVPTAAHLEDYASIVRHKSTLRRLIDSGRTITELGYEEDQILEDVLDKAEQAVYEVSQKQQKHSFTPINDILNRSFDRLDELSKSTDSIRGLRTGFHDLDNMLAGLQKSDLIILAARPAMGKTTLAINIAQHAALKEGVPVGIFTLEMSQDQLVDRMLATEAKVDSWKLRTGNLNEEEFARIGDVMGQLSEAPIFIDDTPSISVMEMRTIARRMQSEHGIGLIVIDYLQLMSGRSTDNRVQEVSEISRGLKALAREVDVPVLALAQLSRTVESRVPQIPQLSDLRESGSIEQDADLVMFIYRDDYYNPDTTERPNIADIIVAKHRNGPVGKRELFFHPEFVAFRNLDTHHQSTPTE